MGWKKAICKTLQSVWVCLGYSQTSKERRSTLDVTSESASLWVIVHSQRVIGYII